MDFLWISIDFLWIPMDFYGFLGIPIDSYGFLGIPIDSHGFPVSSRNLGAPLKDVLLGSPKTNCGHFG
jgi:hypothetical protein